MLTKDSVTVSVDAVVYYRVSNATVSVANVENAHHSTRLLAQTTLRNVLGTKNLSEILSERESISNSMQVGVLIWELFGSYFPFVLVHLGCALGSCIRGSHIRRQGKRVFFFKFNYTVSQDNCGQAKNYFFLYILRIGFLRDNIVVFRRVDMKMSYNILIRGGLINFLFCQLRGSVGVGPG